ncbi:helix-turn-helix transcriptional regulator [Clostridium paraputrificum]
MRKKMGLNQDELSKLLKVSRQTISAIETGKYNPSLELAFQISDLFEMPIEEIFLWKESHK